MGSETMSDKKYKCPCGKSTLRIIKTMDDWNRTDEFYIINCDECKKYYDGSTFNYNGNLEEV
jgi:hypothetical protein